MPEGLWSVPYLTTPYGEPQVRYLAHAFTTMLFSLHPFGIRSGG